MKSLLLKLQGIGEILRYFSNPLLVIALRLGLLKVPLFPYRIVVGDRSFSMLGRPSSASMSDLFVLREVLVEETYGDLIPLLEKGPLRTVDVGGNLGSFSIWLHQRHGIREGYCFEPDPTSFNLCRYNLANNGCAAVQVLPKAMGGVARHLNMSVDTSRPGGNSIYQANTSARQTVQVEVLAFPQWLGSVEGEWDVLKLDCEGAEWEILDNTVRDQIRRFKIIIAEVHTDHAGKHEVADFPKILSGHGFKTLRWDGHEQGLYVGQRSNQT